VGSGIFGKFSNRLFEGILARNCRKVSYKVLKMDSKRKKKLKKIAILMNKQTTRPIPTFLSATTKVLDAVLTPKETDFLIAMGGASYTQTALKAHLELPEEKFSKYFNSLIQKGILWSQSPQKGDELFEISPMMVGWFELQMSNGNRTPDNEKFFKSLTALFDSFKKFNFFLGRSFVNMYYRLGGAHWSVAPIEAGTTAKEQVVQVDESLDVPESHILRPNSVNALIEKYGAEGKIAVSHCVCRQHWAFEGEPCRLQLPTESHIWLGAAADHVIKYNLARPISREEALTLIKTIEEKGGIHEVMYTKMDLKDSEMCICNCCWDCCNSIGAFNRGQIPLYIKSYFLATLPDESLCTGCGTCSNYCPVSAILINEGKATIKIKRCIGCGQCELHCPNKAIQLIPKERTVWLPMEKKSHCRIPS
jgi:Pyruvate/2-oxoacid:ferredoxin oxidoreductase delta subunit